MTRHTQSTPVSSASASQHSTMVVPTPLGMDVSGVAALALRAYIVDKHGDQGMRNMLTQQGAAAVLELLDNLEYNTIVPWAIIARVMACLRDHFHTEILVTVSEYGQFLFSWVVAESGYERSVFQVSNTFFDFVKSLNRLLLQMFATLDTATAGLTFKPHCMPVSSTSFDFCGFVLASDHEGASVARHNPKTEMHLELHKGILKRAAAQVFGLDLEFSPAQLQSIPSGRQRLVTRVSFQPVKPTSLQPVPTIPRTALQDKPTEAADSITSAVGLGPDSCGDMFPFHFVLDLDLRVLQAGRAIRRLLPRMVPGVHINEVLEVCVPSIPWDMDYLNVRTQNSMHSEVILTSLWHQGLAFKGGLNRVPAGAHVQADTGCRTEWGEALMFLGSPLISSVEEMRQHSLYLSDFPPNDMTADHILMDDTRVVKAACTLRLAQERNDKLQAALAEALSSQDVMMSRPELDTTSVADLVLDLLDGLIMGHEVSTQEVLAVRTALLQAEGSNMWSPLVLDARAIDGDEEVNESLGKLLGAKYRRGSSSMDCAREVKEAPAARPPPPQRQLSRVISLAAGRKSSENSPSPLSCSAAPCSDLRPPSLPGQPAAPSRAEETPKRQSPAAPAASRPVNDDALPATQLPQEPSASAAAACAVAVAHAPPCSLPNGTSREQSATEESCRSAASRSLKEPSGTEEVCSSRPCSGALTSSSPSCLSWFKTKLRVFKGSKPPKPEKVLASSTPGHVKPQTAEAATETVGTICFAPERHSLQLAVPAAAAATAAAAPLVGAVQPLVVVQTALITQLLQQPSDQLAAALGCVDDWQFDSFHLEQAAGGRPLSCLAFFLIKRMDLVHRLSLNENKMARFLLRIEDGYPDHPYHNRSHAADVLRSLYVVMTQGGVMDALKAHGAWSCGGQAAHDGGANATHDSVGLLSVMLAAIVHDYEHKGVNNDFLIRSCDPLAMLYNDISPLENHHVSASMSLMRLQDYAFLPPGPASNKLQGLMRKDIIDMVLATDMKQHFALSGTFSSKVAQQAPQAPGAVTHGQTARRKNPYSGGNLRKLVLKDQADLDSAAFPHGDPQEHWDQGTQMLVLKMALKCSDLGHLTSTTDVHRQWVGRLEEELFLQGDQEHSLGQPVSALMDRTKTGITKSQVGFINVVAQPMFELLAQAFPACQPLVNNLNTNVDFWKAVEAGVSVAAGG